MALHYLLTVFVQFIRFRHRRSRYFGIDSLAFKEITTERKYLSLMEMRFTLMASLVYPETTFIDATQEENQPDNHPNPLLGISPVYLYSSVALSAAFYLAAGDLPDSQCGSKHCS
jgi:hypothetical protein